MRRRPVDWRGWGLLAGVLGACALVLVVLEARARRTDPARWTGLQMERRTIDGALARLEPCVTRAQHDGETWLTAQRAAAPGNVRLRRTPGIARVVYIGESTAMLMAGAAQLAVASVRARAPYEVLDCSVPGGAIDHVERRLDEAMALAPDVLVIVFGQNVRLVPVDPVVLRRRRWFTYSAFLASFGGPTIVEPPVAPIGVQVARFEALVQRAAALTGTAGVRLVVTTLAPNFWMPPAALPASLDHDDPGGAEYRYLVAAGRSADARAVADASANRAVASFRRGEIAWLEHDVAGAERALTEALDDPTQSNRVPSTVTPMLRRAAAATGADLVDLDRDVRAQAPGGLPGWESFRDDTHLLPEWIARAAHDVFSLTDRHIGRSETTVDALSFARTAPYTLVERLRPHTAFGVRPAAAMVVASAMAHDPAGTRAELRAWLDREVLTRAVDDPWRIGALDAVIDGLQRAGDPATALALAEVACRAQSAVPWMRRALLAVTASDRATAITAIDRAVQLAPAQPGVRRLAALVHGAPP